MHMAKVNEGKGL